jgi:hypothetical protein
MSEWDAAASAANRAAEELINPTSPLGWMIALSLNSWAQGWIRFGKPDRAARLLDRANAVLADWGGAGAVYHRALRETLMMLRTNASSN